MQGPAGGGIEVRRHGAGGPEVVLLHGGPGAPGSVGDLALDLARWCRVHEPLQRRSGGPPLTVARHVEDLAAVAPPAAAYVGWSWGAMLALSFASAHPGRATSLALVGCGTYDETTRALYRQRLDERLGSAGRARRDDLGSRMAGERDPAVRDALLAARGALAEAAQAVDPLPDRPDAPPSPPVDARGNAETWGDVLALQAGGREPSAFAGIRAPAAMFHGAEDPHPGEATWRLLRPHLRRLVYVEFPRCGHAPWRERHARLPFLRMLGAWITLAGDGPEEGPGG